MSWCGLEALPNVRKWSGVPFRMNRSGRGDSRMSVNGRETLSDVLEWLGGLPGCPGLVGRPSHMLGVFGSPSQMPGVVGRPSQMCGIGQETLRMSRNFREAVPDVKVWSRGPPGCPGVVERPSRKFGNGRETLQDVL